MLRSEGRENGCNNSVHLPQPKTPWRVLRLLCISFPAFFVNQSFSLVCPVRSASTKYGPKWCPDLDDVPDVFGGVAELAASNTGTEGVVADTDGIILEFIGERVVSLGHCADEDADALVRTEILNVVPNSHDLGIE